MAVDRNTGWGKVINDEYKLFYGRDATDQEIWGISEQMNGRPMSIADIKAAVQQQSGAPKGGDFLQGDQGTASQDPVGGRVAGAREPSNNRFIGADSSAHFNDLITQNKGDLAVLAERLLGNQEGAQGGRFAAPIRARFGDKAQNLEGLLGLEAAGNITPDTGMGVAEVFNQQLGQGSRFDTPGRGIGKSLLDRVLTEGGAKAQAYLKGDPAAQLKALKAALTADASPLLANQLSQQADEDYKQWLGQHASDPGAASAFGSFLEHAKRNGLF